MNTIQKKIVIIGAGPAGIGAAVRLAETGHRDLLLLERFSQAGGIPSRYPERGKPTFIEWTRGRIRHGRRFAENLSGKLAKREIDVRLETAVTRVSPDSKEIEAVSRVEGWYRIQADAIVMACGARESTAMERGGVFGQRPARVYNTLHLLQLADQVQVHPPVSCSIIGSEALSYATADKLSHYSGLPAMIDNRRLSVDGFFGRLYFFPLRSPRRYAPVESVQVSGQMGLEMLKIPSHTDLESDYLYLSGRLVPNTELLASEGISFDGKTRQISGSAAGEMRSRGIFIAGNMSGSASGGKRAYLNGRRCGELVSEYLG